MALGGIAIYLNPWQELFPSGILSPRGIAPVLGLIKELCHSKPLGIKMYIISWCLM